MVDIAIRGLSDLTAGGNERIIQTRPAIGINVDEFSVASVSSGSANPPLNDIERVEILRGPQGTYFGRKRKRAAQSTSLPRSRMRTGRPKSAWV